MDTNHCKGYVLNDGNFKLTIAFFITRVMKYVRGIFDRCLERNKLCLVVVNYLTTHHLSTSLHAAGVGTSVSGIYMTGRKSSAIYMGWLICANYAIVFIDLSNYRIDIYITGVYLTR